MRKAQLLCVMLPALMLSACISMTTVIKVRSDGGGTVTQTVVLPPEMAEMMAGLAAMGQEEGASPELFPEKELRSKAAEMGPGVKLVSSRKITGKDGEGVEAVYSFEDINTLKVEQKPTPPMEGVSSAGESEAPEFRLTPLAGGSARLVVTFPEPKPKPTEGEESEESEKPSKQPDARELEQAREILKGLRFGLYVDAGTSVIKTSSPYLDGNRVTLMEMDFEALLGNEKKFREFVATAEDGSLETAKRVLKDLPGIKVHLDREVTIDFK